MGRRSAELDRDGEGEGFVFLKKLMSGINQEIAALFQAKADILLAKGDKYKFRALAYSRAARAIEKLERGWVNYSQLSFFDFENAEAHQFSRSLNDSRAWSWDRGIHKGNAK